jgi:hypothetical protein
VSYQTEPAPPPTDETQTDPDGRRDAALPAEDVLSVEAAVAMLPRLIAGVEALGREVRDTARDLRTAVQGLHLAIDQLSSSLSLVLRESQLHAQRLSDVERRIAGLRCQSGGECEGAWPTRD